MKEQNKKKVKKLASEIDALLEKKKQLELEQEMYEGIIKRVENGKKSKK